ncbi:MAG: hypothetical protein HYW07_12955 [Candidatus Latescibacteria bacterium]|nr:hypothetical protein [Candidatus Latescibacterota bacterium]
MAAPESRAEHFRQDCADYRAMYQLGLEQRDCIAREDLEGLGNSFRRLRRLMDRIRLRQAGRPAAGNSPEEEGQREELRRVIAELQELRRGNEAAVQGLLSRTREELRQFQQGRRSLRGYQTTRPSEARFFDGVR